MTDQTDKPKSRRGGKRAGAGRKKKGFVSPSQLAELDLARAKATPPPDEIDGPAQRRAHDAIEALVTQMLYGASESARVAAANEILDRGYGKPAVEIGGDAAMLPFMEAPAAAITLSRELRAAARRFANLAIETLERIMKSGASESARVSAAKSLLNRGLGTVAPARMPEELRQRPMGKKEQAATAAQLAATGRFATPPPPRNLQ